MVWRTVIQSSWKVSLTIYESSRARHGISSSINKGRIGVMKDYYEYQFKHFYDESLKTMF